MTVPPSSALAAVIEALGKQEVPLEIPEAARAEPNMDAASLLNLLAQASPAVREAVTIGECTATECCTCHQVYEQEATNTCVEVDVSAPKTLALHGGLRFACEPEQFGDEANPVYECGEACKKPQAALRRVHPCAPWPSRLFIILRRYTFDFTLGSWKKGMHRVTFPSRLDLAAMCEAPLGTPPAPGYSLLGAVVHTGPSTFSGIYSYEKALENLARVGLDDSGTVQDVSCPGGATPLILVYGKDGFADTSAGFGDVASSMAESTGRASGSRRSTSTCGCSVM
mmetsp:Transcript_9444/g.27580  ORF Transcript_9444/g.27580 Transcript_9444/m.27580 type:complete len:283 (+) Transcript_9444:65-913(+)